MSLSATVPCAHKDRSELVERFVAEVRAVAASVECIDRSPSAIAAAVGRVGADAKRIFVADPHDIPDALFSICRQMTGVFTECGRYDLATADVGVTDAFAAISTTGTVCVRVDAGMTGYASLLPRTHVAVIDSERIVERPGDLFRRDCLNGEGLRTNFVFVTGPSATADMGPLVRGVHGPHYLHVVVLI
jgi:L-lactate dehydrogenase complex protein LldG